MAAGPALAGGIGRFFQNHSKSWRVMPASPAPKVFRSLPRGPRRPGYGVGDEVAGQGQRRAHAETSSPTSVVERATTPAPRRAAQAHHRPTPSPTGPQRTETVGMDWSRRCWCRSRTSGGRRVSRVGVMGVRPPSAGQWDGRSLPDCDFCREGRQAKSRRRMQYCEKGTPARNRLAGSTVAQKLNSTSPVLGRAVHASGTSCPAADVDATEAQGIGGESRAVEGAKVRRLLVGCRAGRPHPRAGALVEVEVRPRPRVARGTAFAAALQKRGRRGREAADESRSARPGVEPGTPR